ncbi:MAG: D-TA family PLP-dependent enzyme [Anaerolineales bacterium]|nr:D-TA family PLP-dependent enzyme [Anaerolineales bacterium]
MPTLDTPYVFVDLDLMEANLARLQTYLDQHGLANRPHIKTHKIPALARRQVALGAVGITCQKLGEVEVMAEAGLTDIFLPYNLVGAAKLDRLSQLLKAVSLSLTTDSAVVARGLSSAAQQAGRELTILVECDMGARRCGVQSPQEAADLARVIARLPGLRFGGLMTYPNRPELDDFVGATRALLGGELPIERVSGGGSACMWEAHTHRALTEHRAGMYLFGDRSLMTAGAVPLEHCAFGVRTTVVSRPTRERGVLDAGSKVLSSDTLGLEGFGYIREYPDARITGLSEEHGHVDFTACPRRPEIGEIVTVIPNHCCPVVNLADELVGLRHQAVDTVWAVTARGRVR